MLPAPRDSLPLGLAVGVFVLAIALAHAMKERPHAMRSPRTLLLTGFGPFGLVAANPAWEVTRALDGRTIGRTAVRAARLDVVYDRAAQQLEAALRETRPDMVLCLGVAPGKSLRLETVARNRDGCTDPDSAGVVREDVPIREGGPELLVSRLPVSRILARLQAGGFEVETSDDAGGYLCNHVFYAALDRTGDDLVAGFVHVPALGESWDLARLTDAVIAIVEELDR